MALILAAQAGRHRHVARLLDLGYDIEGKDDEDRTALIWAASHGHREVVALLLDRGAEASARDEYGDTAAGLADSDEIKDMLRVR
jgi:uncharacterized protein